MTEPELRALAARDATAKGAVALIDAARAERDALRDAIALSLCLAAITAELDAERERVRVLREALQHARNQIRHPDQMIEAALATTEPKP